jgi:c-di-GMP-binding flagellar brake protein YcgR
MIEAAPMRTIVFFSHHWMLKLWGLSADRLNPFTHLSSAERMIWFCLLAAVLFLFFVSYLKAYRRRAVAERLQALEEAHVTTSQALQEGMSATLEVLQGGESRRIRAFLRAIEHKMIALTLEGDAETTLLRIGTPVRITVAGVSAAYRFHACVQDRRKVEAIPTIYLAKPQWIEKVQRREFYRVPVQLPTSVIAISDSLHDRISHRGMIIDLSAGGARLAISRECAPGTLLRLRLPMEEMESIGLEARVIACQPWQTDGAFPCLAHCEFLYMPDETRTLLMRCCFDLERRWLHARRREERRASK